MELSGLVRLIGNFGAFSARNLTFVAMTVSSSLQNWVWFIYGVWFAEKTYTAMAVPAVLGATVCVVLSFESPPACTNCKN